MKTETILRNSKERISNKEHWTTGTMYGRRGRGRGWYNGTLAEANCFCSIGSVGAELGIPERMDISAGDGALDDRAPDWVKETAGKNLAKAIRYLAGAARTILREAGFHALANGGRNGEVVWNVNDWLGHEAAMRMFDIAIKRARRRHANGG